MTELPEWQRQFQEWYNQRYPGRFFGAFEECSGVSRNTWSKYLGAKPVRLDLLQRQVKQKLYTATGLEFFKVEDVRYGRLGDGKAPLEHWQVELIEHIEKNYEDKVDFCRRTGLKPGAVRYLTEEVRTLNRITRRKKELLYKATGLEVFNSTQANPQEPIVCSQEPTPSIPRQQITGQQPLADNRPQSFNAELAQVVGELYSAVIERVPVPVQETNGDLVQQTVALFYQLAKKLEGFKADPDVRDRLVKKLSKSDVGRVTSLLHAMYKSKDDFEQWMMLSGYAYREE